MTQDPNLPLHYDMQKGVATGNRTYFLGQIRQWLAPLDLRERQLPIIPDTPLIEPLLQGYTVVVTYSNTRVGIQTLKTHIKAALSRWAMKWHDDHPEEMTQPSWVMFTPREIMHILLDDDVEGSGYDKVTKQKVEYGELLIINAADFPRHPAAQRHINSLMQDRISRNKATFFCVPNLEDLFRDPLQCDSRFQDLLTNQELVEVIKLPATIDPRFLS